MKGKRSLWAVYLAHFADQQHNTDLVIENYVQESGHFLLCFELDGIRFAGTNFWEFELEEEADTQRAEERFHLLCLSLKGDKGEEQKFSLLQRYSLEVEVPIPVVEIKTAAVKKGLIQMQFSMAEDKRPRAQSGLFCDREILYADSAECNQFCLAVENNRFFADHPTTCFESAMIQVIKKCKPFYQLQCCFTCQYSDYSPYGADDFGSMLCYRHDKEEYLKVNDKKSYFQYVGELKPEIQQETNICSEYRERTIAEGYRGFLP